MRVFDPNGHEILHKKKAKTNSPRWTWTAKEITISFPSEHVPPNQAYTLEFDKAIERERRFFYDPSGPLSPENFTRARLQLGHTNYAGLLLPAPSKAGFRFRVPKSAELTLKAGILPSEVTSKNQSDGALLRMCQWGMMTSCVSRPSVCVLGGFRGWGASY